MTLGIIIAYLGLVLGIGVLSHRFAMATGEDYFVARRAIGPLVLLMTLFGTHMTSFAMLGSSAESYRVGIGVFTLMASSSALVVPLLFLFLGTRVWALGKRFGYLTQVQYVRDRWQSDLLGLLLFVALVVLLVPYLLIGVMGGGITLREITGAAVPEWVGSLMICGVVLVYVSYGGMRGTSWVNTFQTMLFMLLGAVTAIVIVRDLGGLGAAMARVSELHPELLVRGDRVGPMRVLTYTFVPLSAGMFPHIFVHWLTAERATTFRAAILAYPLCIVVVWVPMVVLGVLGRLDFPELAGPAVNSVLIQQIALHAPEALAGLLGAGVFAAIMSSLDSQSLALGSMFTQDVVRHYRLAGGDGDDLSDQRQVLFGRLFVALVLAVTFLLSQVTSRNIFVLGVWSFTGFAALLPILIAGLYWRRSTAAGALASLASVVALWIFFFARGWGRPDYSVLGLGIMPVAVIFLAASLVLVVVSLLTRPPDEGVLERFFG